MRIEYDVKLDFSDVLIRPKRSVLKSRAEVLLEREFRFRNSGTTWHGVPIIAANMDHTGTFEMGTALAQHGLLTAMDKFHTADDWHTFVTQHPEALPSCFVSIGISEREFQGLQNHYGWKCRYR
jgi:GMP reductase